MPPGSAEPTGCVYGLPTSWLFQAFDDGENKWAGKGRAEINLLTSRTAPRRKEQRESLLWKHYLSEPSCLAFLCMSWSGRMEHPQT